MNRSIASLTTHLSGSTTISRAKASFSTSFAEELRQATGARSAPDRNVAAGGGILVGEISSSHQTVSELLMRHPELKGSTWNILSAAANRGRDFTRLAPGTRIYYNPDDHSLNWTGTGDARGDAVAKAAPARKLEMPSQPVTPVQAETATAAEESTQLGVISRELPTVSHLLKAHQEFGRDTWRILSAGVNRGKDFSRLPIGAAVSIDSVTREISWHKGSGLPVTASAPEAVQARPASPEETMVKAASTAADPKAEAGPMTRGGGAGDLTEAVRPFLGRNYKDINCYELLVKGLERMNIPYGGKDGLFTKLTRMAREQGLPANAYLNGEGVVKAAGSLVLARNYPHTANWKREAEQLYREMEPLLSKGQILSFSTRRRGHTGIISQQDQQWTFINSGRLDNSLTEGSPRKGVGEENLVQEIRNWFKLASSRGESLSVTLGSLGQDTVVAETSQLPVGGEPRRI